MELSSFKRITFFESLLQALGWICYWYPHTVMGILIALAEYVITYFIIWFCIYQNYKKQVNQINEFADSEEKDKIVF